MYVCASIKPDWGHDRHLGLTPDSVKMASFLNLY